LRGVREFLQVLPLAALLGIAACAGTTEPPADAAPPATAKPSAARSPAVPTPLGPDGAAGAGATSTLSAGPVAAPGDYLIGPQDLLKVEVFGVEAMNRSVRVNSSGQIALPLIGLVPAAGLTGEQLAAEIAARLAKDYLQNPQVTIFIEEFTSQRVTVVGAVKSPGVYPLRGKTTLLQVVAGAGGPTSVALRDSILVLRSQQDGTRKMLQFDLDAITGGKAPDPEVRGEDVVQIEASAVKETAKQVMEFVLPFWFLAP